MKTLKQDWLYTLLLIVGLYWFLGFHEALSYRPISIHQNAQCSRASIALNYAKEDMNFFLPRVHGCKNTSGITGSEFPLIQYIVAIFYKIFGFNEFWYRFIMLCSISVSIFYIIKLAKQHLNNYPGALFITLCWFCSPVLIFYSPNFNPDTASLAFTMISWYFFFLFLKSHKHVHILVWFILITIATLLKVVSLISLVTIVGLIVLQHIGFLKFKISTKQKLHFILYFLASVIIVVLWYKYARYLTETSGNKQFSLRSRQAKSLESALDVWRYVSATWLPYYYNKVFYSFLLFTAIITSILYQNISRLLASITVLLYLGALSFIFLMLPQFRDHDYYIITLLPAIFFHLLTFANAVQKKFSNTKLLPLASTAIFCGLFIHSAIHAKSHQESRYGGEYSRWSTEFTNVFELETKIRELGISREEKFFVYEDWTPNNTLYLIDQKGWTASWSNSSNYLLEGLKDCEYALISKPDFVLNPKFSHFFKEPIVAFEKDLILFKLTKDQAYLSKDSIINRIEQLYKQKTEIRYTFETCDSLTYKGTQNIKMLELDKRCKLSTTHKHSGSSSLLIDETKLYSPPIKITNFNKKIVASLWYYSKNNPLTICAQNKKDIYQISSEIVEENSRGWKKIQISVSPSFYHSGTPLSVHAVKKTNDTVYIDDFVIEYLN